MAKDAKGHGSNEKAMRALEATSWDKLSDPQKDQLRAYKQERHAKAEKSAEKWEKKGVPYKAFPSRQEMAGMEHASHAAEVKALKKVRATTRNKKY